MTAQSEGYSHARHSKQVLAAARAAGIKNGSIFVVLEYLCSVSDFKKPTVRVSKARICERTGYHWDTVRLALRALRARGLIEPIAYATGGKACATVYKLTTKGPYGAENPPSNGKGPIGGGNSGQYGAENPVYTGRKIRPPSEYSSYISSGGEGGAFRAGRNVGTLDAGASPGPRSGPTRTPEEQALFDADLRTMMYGEAIYREKARKRAGGELP